MQVKAPAAGVNIMTRTTRIGFYNVVAHSGPLKVKRCSLLEVPVASVTLQRNATTSGLANL